MMTVCEAGRISGVSIRTLHYYDRIGLLPATEITEAGYRLYDESALERLQMILLFRELEFPLKEIGRILDSTDFDRDRALEQQIQLLELKRERLENIISLAKKMKMTGGEHMSFQEFDDGKIKEYEKRAKESWGHTEAYEEYEKKAKGRTVQEQKKLGTEMMGIFEKMGQIREQEPDSIEALALVKTLQEHISENYYFVRMTFCFLSGQCMPQAGNLRKISTAREEKGRQSLLTEPFGHIAGKSRKTANKRQGIVKREACGGRERVAGFSFLFR